MNIGTTEKDLWRDEWREFELMYEESRDLDALSDGRQRLDQKPRALYVVHV